MKLDKYNLTFGLLAIVSLILTIYSSSGVLAVITIGYIMALAVRNFTNVSAENIASGVSSATIGELIDERMTERAWNKTAIDTGPIKLR